MLQNLSSASVVIGALRVNIDSLCQSIKTVDSDQLSSSEATPSGSALFYKDD